MTTVEVAVMLVPVIVEVLAGLIVVWVAIRLRQGRVARGSAVGVRTRSTMRSDAAFETAEHLAGVFIFGGAGVFLLLILIGTATGVRASRSVP